MIVWLSSLTRGGGDDHYILTSPEGQHDPWDQQSLQRSFPCHVGEDFKMVK